MYKQFKFISGSSLDELQENLNNFTADIDSNPTVTWIKEYLVMVEINTVTPNHICCECANWSDGGVCDAIYGECPARGLRRRYSDPACGKYERKKQL